jgi:hypothetical protein
LKKIHYLQLTPYDDNIQSEQELNLESTHSILEFDENQSDSIHQETQDLRKSIKKRKKKELTSIQKALKDLQEGAKRCIHLISGKLIKNIMTKVFLARFPQGTDLYVGHVSYSNQLKKASIGT